MTVPSCAHFVATLDGIALEILAVGDEHDAPHVILRLRIAREQLARALERARDRRAADGHVVRIELAEELRDRGAVARQREAHRLAGEGDRARSARRASD